MAEPLNERDIKALLQGAREHYVEQPDLDEVDETDEAADSSKRQRMYRGQPVADSPKSRGGGRQRSYRGAPVRATGNKGARSNQASSLTDKLRQLQHLRDSGVIDQAEFARLKKALLD